MIRLSLPVPPSANRYWRKTNRGTTYLSEDARDYRALVADYCRRARVVPLEGDVAMLMIWYRRTRQGDASNRVKQLEDALQGFAYHDDKQVADSRIIRLDVDRKRPRVEVIVRPFDLDAVLREVAA